MLNDWVDSLSKLTNLTSLEVTYPSVSLSDDTVVKLLGNLLVGSNLVHLDLSGNAMLSDVTVLTGIPPNSKKLNSLGLAYVPLVTDECLADFFSTWTDNPALEVIDASRNNLLGSSTLLALLAQSGQRLTTLNING